ncbi:hypothetical protein K1719_002736 [Acacia pycnantha]|nr:hypothetical protein K1719_002736 [Acacia pycnantha]
MLTLEAIVLADDNLRVHQTPLINSFTMGMPVLVEQQVFGGCGNRSGEERRSSEDCSVRLRDGEGWPNRVINFAVNILMGCSSASKTKPIAYKNSSIREDRIDRRQSIGFSPSSSSSSPDEPVPPASNLLDEVAANPSSPYM